MGSAIYLYLHMLDRANWDDGVYYEWIDASVANELEMPMNTVRDYRKQLEAEGYITCKQRQHSQDIIIHNWTDPRTYDGTVINESDPQGDVQGDPQDVLGQGINSVPSSSHISHNHMSVNSKKIIEPERESCDPDGITESMGLGYGGVRKKKVTKEREVVPPAIVAYHSVTGRYPRKELYPQIIEVVGDNPDVPFMRECFVEWLKVSQNPSPWRWLFEWYKNKKITVNGGTQKESTLDKNMALIQKFVKEGSNG